MLEAMSNVIVKKALCRHIWDIPLLASDFPYEDLRFSEFDICGFYPTLARLGMLDWETGERYESTRSAE